MDSRLRGSLGGLLLGWLASFCLSVAAADFEEVRIPWRAIRVPQFSDEAATGELTAKLARLAAEPAPFVIFMHGCGGLKLDAVGHWAEFFTKREVSAC
jgi:hypothetical protein